MTDCTPEKRCPKCQEWIDRNAAADRAEKAERVVAGLRAWVVKNIRARQETANVAPMDLVNSSKLQELYATKAELDRLEADDD